MISGDSILGDNQVVIQRYWSERVHVEGYVYAMVGELQSHVGR